MLSIFTKKEMENILEKIPQNSEFQIIYTSKKLKLNNNVKNILIVITALEIADYKQTKKLIKKILKLQKYCIKRNIKMSIFVNNEEVSAILLNEEKIQINSKYYTELNTVINLAKFKNKNERIEYIYDSACEYLDNECKRLNYCDFQNDVCIYKRTTTNETPRKMGCCYRVKLFPIEKHEVCEYLKDGVCTTKCLACKMYTCDGIKIKYRIKDIIYLDCFFNPLQKLILRFAILTSKEKIISLISVLHCS